MARWNAGSSTVNGINLHYYRTGGNKPALVFAHGITDNGLCWAPLVRMLETDYDCIMVDARGHGWSDAPESGYTNKEHAADYAALIQRLGLAQPVLIGHSMGGGISAQVAADYPGLVQGVILEDPPWRPLGSIASPEERRVRAEEWRSEVVVNQARALDQLLAAVRVRSPAWSDAELNQWAPAKHQVSPRALDYVLYPSTPWWEVIGQIGCPTLLITADVTAGAIVDAATAAQATALNSRIKAIAIAGAGHNIRREQFDAYVAAVKSFLSTLY